MKSATKYLHLLASTTSIKNSDLFSEIYAACLRNLWRFLPLIKTHHYFFASRLGLATEHKALFSFPFFQGKVLFHDYAPLHDFGAARTAYAAFA
jgi:hypothetical protein